jgi:hypothetical protein
MFAFSFLLLRAAAAADKNSFFSAAHFIGNKGRFLLF